MGQAPAVSRAPSLLGTSAPDGAHPLHGVPRFTRASGSSSPSARSLPAHSVQCLRGGLAVYIVLGGPVSDYSHPGRAIDRYAGRRPVLLIGIAARWSAASVWHGHKLDDAVCLQNRGRRVLRQHRRGASLHCRHQQSTGAYPQLRASRSRGECWVSCSATSGCFGASTTSAFRAFAAAALVVFDRFLVLVWFPESLPVEPRSSRVSHRRPQPLRGAFDTAASPAPTWAAWGHVLVQPRLQRLPDQFCPVHECAVRLGSTTGRHRAS